MKQIKKEQFNKINEILQQKPYNIPFPNFPLMSKDRKKILLKPYIPIPTLPCLPTAKPPTHSILQIFPQQVTFTDVLLNQTYEINITIRNVTVETRKVRLFVPLSPYFSVRYEQKLSSLASGLAMRVTVVFDANMKEEEVYKADLRIVSEDFDWMLPLRAYIPEGCLHIPQIINFGYVDLGKTVSQVFQVTNKGKKRTEATVKVIGTEDVGVYPNHVSLSGGQSTELTLQYTASEITTLRARLVFQYRTLRQIKKQIFLRATTLDGFCFVCDQSNKKIDCILLPQLYIGQNPSYTYKVINNTCNTVRWKASLLKQNRNKKGDPVLALISSPRTLAREQQQRVVHITPEQSVIKPYSELRITVAVFRKPTQEDIAAVERSMAGVASLDGREVAVRSQLNFQFTEEDGEKPSERIILPVECTFVLPRVGVSQTVFQFGYVQLKTSATLTFQVSNSEARELPIDFEHNSANFVIKGAKKLLGKETKIYQVIFSPKVPGNYSEIIRICILGTYYADMKVFGSSRQISVLKPRNCQKSTSQTNLSTTKLSKSYNMQRRAKRSQQQLQSFVRSRLQRTLALTATTTNTPIDPIFQAGVLPLPKPTKIQLPFYSEQLYVDTEFKQKRLGNFNDGTGRVWPSEPKNNRETRDIVEKLTQEELKLIIVSTSQIDFGVVFIKSESTKKFSVKNNTAKFILVEMQIYHEELRKSGNKKQVIPPKETAVFHIVLESKTSGDFKATVKYSINSNHSFQFLVTANLIPITLQPSSKLLKLQFQDNNMSFSTSQNFRLYNNGNACTKFKFCPPVNQTSAFEVEPNQGEVQPQSYMELRLIYTPECLMNETSSYRVDEEKKYFKVFGGNEASFRCMGTVAESKCTVKETEIQLGEVAVSTMVESKFTIKNLSRLATIFKVELEPESLSQHIKFDQLAYRLGPEEKKEVGFTFCCKTEKNIKGDIVCTVRAARKFRIAVSAKCLVPKVWVLQKQINFGKVTTLGHSFIQTFHIRNDSHIKANIQICPNILDMKDIVEIECAQGFQEFVLRGQDDETNLSDISSVTDNSQEAQDSQVMEFKKNYGILMPPNSQVKLVLKISPKIVGEYEFRLPIRFKGFEGFLESLSKRVTYEAIEPTLLFEPQIIDFKKKIISDKDHKVMAASLCNPSDKPIRWKIVLSSLSGAQGQNPFKIQPNTGQLQPDAKIMISAFFSPCSATQYQGCYKMIVNDSQNSDSEFKMIGSGILPSLIFDRKQLIFPVVPIGIQSKISFRIQNDGYDNISLNKWRIEQTPPNIQIKLDFKQGRTLSIMKKRILIQATFKSTSSISLTSMLIFTDECFNRFVLPVSATCDNSLMTLYSYLETNQGDYRIVWDEKGGYQLTDSVYSEYEVQSRKRINTVCSSYKKEPQIAGIKLPSPNFLKRTANYICRWLQYFVTERLSVFPKGVSEANGQAFLLMLQTVSNRPYKPIDLPADRIAKITQLIAFYDDVIRQLKSQGCLLNHIRPQYLLGQADYSYYYNHIQGKQSVSSLSAMYQLVTTQCWSVMFYQSCKVFLFPKINLKFMKNIYQLFGIEPPKLPPSSNIYSPSELLVLNFVNALLGDKEKRVTSFDDVRFKGEFFAVLLDRMLGTDLADKVKVITKESRLEDISYNCQLVSAVMSQFGLGFYTGTQDLAVASPVEILLFLYHLLISIPLYFSKQTIKFLCELRQQTHKTLQLSNPSTKQVNYWAKILGDQGFTVQTSDVTIQPKQTVQVRVSYMCRFFKGAQAKLFFIQKQQDDLKNRVAPVVFTLKTEVMGKTLSKTVNFEAYQYEMMVLGVEVESPFLSVEYPFEATVSLLEEDRKEKKNGNAAPLQCFFLNSNKIKLYKSKESKLELKFIAMAYENRSCRISFFQPMRGEFIYEIQVTVLRPIPLKTIKLKDVYINNFHEFTLDIPIYNESLIKAKKNYQELNRNFKTKNFVSGSKYIVEANPSDEAIIVPKEITICKSKSEDELLTQEFPLAISIDFKKAYKQYTFFLSIYNQAMTDVRVVKVQFRVLPQPVKVKIHMQTVAKQQLTQWFPIRSYPTKINLQTDSQYLKIPQDCPKDFLVPNLSNTKVAVTFKPNWICRVFGSLSIIDQDTLQEIIYQITATGTQPKHQTTISIKMQNLTKQTKHIQFRTNILNTLNLTPQVSLKYCQLTSTKYTIPQNMQRLMSLSCSLPRVILFELELEPKEVGICYGEMKFIDNATGQYCTYGLVLEVTDFQRKAEVVVSCRAGATKVFMIEGVGVVGKRYNVRHTLPWVIGPSEFEVQDGRVFEMEFSPMKEFQKEEGRVIFQNIQTGEEEWYLVRLISTINPPIKLPQLACQIGDQALTFIPITNPLHQQILYRIQTSNPQFLATPNPLLIPPKSTSTFSISFSPKLLRQICKTQLTLTSPSLLTQKYQLSGVGLQPTVKQKLLFVSDMTKNDQKRILFENPLSSTSTVRVTMEEASSACFVVMSEKRKVVSSQTVMQLEAGRVLEFVVEFQPRRFALETVRMWIELNEKYRWEYELHGLTEIVYHGLNCHMKTQCRNSKTEVFNIADPRIEDNITSVEIDRTIGNPNPKLVLPKLLSNSPGKLSFQLTLCPYKPFPKKKLDLLVINSQGGRWRIPITVQGDPPNVDDTIILESQLGSTVEVSFKLTNTSKHACPFTACLEDNSDIVFDIEPKRGTLEPYGKAGTVFKVYFKPEDVFARYQGLAIIQTEEMYWSFELLGRLPKYTPPTVKPTKK